VILLRSPSARQAYEMARRDSLPTLLPTRRHTPPGLSIAAPGVRPSGALTNFHHNL
jgi:hypothetical protein